MRILMVASEVPPRHSGVAESVGRIVTGAREAGHEVVTRSYQDAPTMIRDQVRLSTLAFRLRRSEMAGFDLVHLHGPAPSLSDVVLLRRIVRSVPVPVVYTHHFTVTGDAVPGVVYRSYDGLMRRLARAADAVVTTTPTYATIVEQAGVEGVEVIPWGVDMPDHVEARSTDDARPLSVLVLGQMRAYKGHLVALEALADLADVTLTLAGSGPLAERIRSATAAVANATMVESPSGPEVHASMAAHDVILLPSTSAVEAFGIVLLEGMAHGCVPVASDLPGLGDVVGDVGVTVRSGDAGDLRRCIAGLAADRGEVARRSAAAIERARSLSWDASIDAYLALYGRIGRNP